MDSLGCEFSVFLLALVRRKSCSHTNAIAKWASYTEPRHPHRPDLVPELEEVKIRRPGKKRYEGTSYLSLDARSVYLRHTTASVSCREGGTNDLHRFMHGRALPIF